MEGKQKRYAPNKLSRSFTLLTRSKKKARGDQSRSTGDNYPKSDDNDNKSSLTTESLVKTTGSKNNSWDKSSSFGTNIQIQDTRSNKPNYDDNAVTLQSDVFQHYQHDHDGDEERASDSSITMIRDENDIIPFVTNECLMEISICSFSTPSLIYHEDLMMDGYLTDPNTVDDYYSSGIIVTGLLHKLVYNNCIL